MSTPEFTIRDDAGPLEREIGGLLLAGKREEAERRIEEEYERSLPRFDDREWWEEPVDAPT